MTTGERATDVRSRPGALAPLIEARAVTRILEGVVPTTLVHDIDMQIGANEFIAVTGPSGSGKSSLLYLLGLLDLPTSGEVRIRGKATAHMSEEERAHIRLSELGFVFQFHFLLPEFSALQNVTLPMRALARLSREEMDERGRMLLGSLGLAEHCHKRPDQLSGGQRQRVVLARALVGRPRLVVADEPTSMVDATLRAGIVALIRQLRDHHGIAFLVITHDLDMAAAVAEQVAVMQRGRLVECGSTPEVFAAPSHDYTKALLRAAADVGRVDVAG